MLPGAELSSGSATVWMLSMTTRLGCTSSSAVMTWGIIVSASNHRSGRSAPSRSARRRTCGALSSALTYRLRPGHAASSWSNRVLLPMPGSPPSRVTDPGTSPMPSTRSSSPSPVACGPPRSPGTSEIGTATADGASSDSATGSGPSTSSVRVFHAWQVVH